ncbi:MAG: OmpA family protein [Rhodospirillales bacterium]|nr:OmpA family protein [Rhodospirillales bacterium]
MTSAPAWCGPAADADVIVDLSVIDSPGAVSQPDSPGPTRAPVPVDREKLFPPPEIPLPSVPSDRAPAGMTEGNTDGTGSPAQGTTMFPPPPPPIAVPEGESWAGGSRSPEATAWRPAPARRPADGPQVALLSPARPPANPHEDAPRPIRKSGPSALEDQSASAGNRLQLIYASNATDIPTPARAQLERLARDVKAAGRLRIRLGAYAGDSDSDNSASRARRTALLRALAIRSLLIDHGIAAGRIDVRALGNTSTSGEADRVDVVVLDK